MQIPEISAAQMLHAHVRYQVIKSYAFPVFPSNEPFDGRKKTRKIGVVAPLLPSAHRAKFGGGIEEGCDYECLCGESAGNLGHD